MAHTNELEGPVQRILSRNEAVGDIIVDTSSVILASGEVIAAIEKNTQEGDDIWFNSEWPTDMTLSEAIEKFRVQYAQVTQTEADFSQIEADTVDDLELEGAAALEVLDELPDYISAFHVYEEGAQISWHRSHPRFNGRSAVGITTELGVDFITQNMAETLSQEVADRLNISELGRLAWQSIES